AASLRRARPRARALGRRALPVAAAVLMTTPRETEAGTAPTATLPRDAADLAELLARARGPFEVVGGGSKRAVGRPPVGAPLDLRALDGVLDYEPAELVLTARAATPLAVVERLLASERQLRAFGA